MLKIEEYALKHHGIKLSQHQVEMITIMAASPEREFILASTSRSTGKSQAFKVAIAYLQDSLKPASDTVQNVISKGVQ